MQSTMVYYRLHPSREVPDSRLPTKLVTTSSRREFGLDGFLPSVKRALPCLLLFVC